MLFFITTITGSIPLPKDKIIESWNDEEITSKVKDKYQSMILEDQSIIITIIGEVKPTGTTLTDNEVKNYTIKFDVLTFCPKLLEIVRGQVVEITDFGAIVRIGPLDALLHLSQILDDYLKTDVKAGMIIANSGKSIKLGSNIRGRITAVSIPQKTGGVIKISLTCRQPHLGPDDWRSP